MKAELFLRLSHIRKMACARRPGPRPLFDGRSMVRCLIEHQPHFLLSGEEWVEILLKAEMHIKSERGENCLMILL